MMDDSRWNELLEAAGDVLHRWEHERSELARDHVWDAGIPDGCDRGGGM